MKYKHLLADKKKKLEELLEEKKKAFIEKYNLFEDQKVENPKDPWDTKRIYESITFEEMNELTLIEEKINQVEELKIEPEIKYSKSISNVMFIIGFIILFSSFIASTQFFEYALEIAFAFIFSGILSASLLFSIGAIIKLLILIIKKQKS